MNAPSPPLTQRSWIMGDVDDGLPPKLPSTPRTPQTLYITEHTESFGKFLSLSEHARGRALEHQKKKINADSARSHRRRSIFDSVKSILLDSNEDIPALTQSISTESSPEVQEKKILHHDPATKGRYKRRGSCTKFSLEHELYNRIKDISDDDDDGAVMFKSFRRNETLQNDEVYSEAEESDSPYRSRRPSAEPTHSRNKTLTTIDQIPLPMRGSHSKPDASSHSRGLDQPPLPTVGRRFSSSHVPRTILADSLSMRDEKRRASLVGSSPQSCKSQRRQEEKSKLRPRMPVLRHVSVASPAKGRSKKPSKGSPKSVSSDSSVRETILPMAPFVHDTDGRSLPGENASIRGSSKSSSSPTVPSEKRRESAPKFGFLLKRLHLQRNDSEKSFAEESTNDDGSMATEYTNQEGRRVPRRSSISTKSHVDRASPSPDQTRKPGWQRYTRPGEGGSFRSASPSSRISSDSRSSPHIRKWA
jgi:hypothetical protein